MVAERDVGIRRATWRIIASVEQKEKAETIEEQGSKLDGGRAAQAPEWEELQRLRAEGLVAIRDTKLLNDSDELSPKWFNVVKDVVDSEDPPLNIYRETLLENKILRVIKKTHVTKCLEMLVEIAELNDAYKKFHEQLVKCMKLGIYEDSTVGVKTAEVLRFNTSELGWERINFQGIRGPHEGGPERHFLHCW